MKNAFIVCSTDVEGLKSAVLDHLSGEQSLHLPYQPVPLLKEGTDVYFVISRSSLYSTAFQSLVMEVFPLTDPAHRYLLRLDDVSIPPNAKSTAANILRSLKDGFPLFK